MKVIIAILFFGLSFSNTAQNDLLIPVKASNGKWGYVNKLGKVIIDFQFLEAKNFYSNHAIVRYGSGYNYVNRKGMLILDSAVSYAYRWTGDYGRVRLPNNKWHYVDEDGVLSENWYQSLGPFKDGLSAVRFAKKYGFVDKKLRLKIALDLEYASDFREGFAYIEKSGVSMLINNRGEVKYKGDSIIIDSRPDNGVMIFRKGTYQSGSYSAYDVRGNILIEHSKHHISPFRSDVSIRTYYIGDEDMKRHSYIIDKHGDQIADISNYQDVSSFKHGLAIARIGAMSMLINTKGNEVFPAVREIGPFQDGLAYVRTIDGEYGYIDTLLNWQIEPKYDLAFSFNNGLACVYSNSSIKYINKSGNCVFGCDNSIKISGYERTKAKMIIVGAEEDLKTPVEAFEKAINGDTILIRDGNYYSDLALELPSGVDNLLIKGEGEVKFLCSSEHAHVFTLSNHNNIKFENILFRHTNSSEADGECTGSVFSVWSLSNLVYKNCNINGCGVYGINGWQLDEVTIQNSKLHNNQYYPIVFNGKSIMDTSSSVPGLHIVNSLFENNGHGLEDDDENNEHDFYDYGDYENHQENMLVNASSGLKSIKHDSMQFGFTPYLEGYLTATFLKFEYDNLWYKLEDGSIRSIIIDTSKIALDPKMVRYSSIKILWQKGMRREIDFQFEELKIKGIEVIKYGYVLPIYREGLVLGANTMFGRLNQLLDIANEGDTLLIESGVYVIAETIEFKNLNNIVIKKDPKSTGKVYFISYYDDMTLFKIEDCTNVNFSEISFKPIGSIPVKNGDYPLIDIYTSSNVKFNNCEFMNAGSEGIRINESKSIGIYGSLFSNISNVAIEFCNDSKSDCIKLRANDSDIKGLDLSGNTFE